MATIFEQINQIALVDILDKVWLSYKVRWNYIELFEDGRLTDGWRWDIVKWIINDFSGKRASGDRITFLMAYFNKDKGEVVNWMKTNFNLIGDESTTQKRQPKRDTFIANMPCDNNLAILKKYLIFRWFRNDQLENISDLASELWSVEKLYISEWVKKDTVLFPMYHDWERVWIKMRTVDGTLFGSMKSWNIKWWHTGLLYKNLTETIIIVEWEPDYLCLKVLGFDSVIWNLWGVASNKDQLKEICKKAKHIIVAYDNDEPGRINSESIDFGRTHFIVKFPEEANDINDLVKMWWSKEDFDDLFKKAVPVKKENDNSRIKEKNGQYFATRTNKDWMKMEQSISNFTIEIENILVLPSENWEREKRELDIKITTKKETLYGTLSAKNSANLMSFKENLKSISPYLSTINMTTDDFDHLMLKLNENCTKNITYVVNKKWFHNGIFTFKEWIWTNNKFYQYDSNHTANIWDKNIKYKGNEVDLPSWQDDDIYYPNHHTYLEDVRYMFNGNQWDLFIWFLVAWLFVEHIKPFPILFGRWKKSSGKTEAFQLWLKWMGMSVSPQNFPDTSIFSDNWSMQELCSIPLVRDEFRQWLKAKEKYSTIRSTYDRSGVTKWTIHSASSSSWLGVINYPTLATLIIIGEESPEDDALLSRMVMLQIEWWRSGGATKFNEIQNNSMYYGSFLRKFIEDGKLDSKKFMTHYKEIRTKVIALGLENRLLAVYLPVIAWFLYAFPETILEDWMPWIIEKTKEKKLEENENDICNYFLDTIWSLYEDGQIWFQEWYISQWNKWIQLCLDYLYTKYIMYDTRIQGRAITKWALKRYFISEYGAYDSTIKLTNWTTQRSLYFTDKIPDLLQNLNNNIISFNLNI